jgi:hypothetical protein
MSSTETRLAIQKRLLPEPVNEFENSIRIRKHQDTKAVPLRPSASPSSTTILSDGSFRWPDDQRMLSDLDELDVPVYKAAKFG